jgi:hypothetical protein
VYLNRISENAKDILDTAEAARRKVCAIDLNMSVGFFASKKTYVIKTRYGSVASVKTFISWPIPLRRHATMKAKAVMKKIYHISTFKNSQPLSLTAAIARQKSSHQTSFLCCIGPESL